MILGHGTVASALTDREGFLFFASGVSNSLETRESEYEREIKLLLDQDTSLHIVYFSTLSIFYNDNRYTRHKRMMEELIKGRFCFYTIVRLGNPTWGENTHHLIPFFRDKLRKGERIKVQDVYRYPLELKEFQHWMEMIPDWSCEFNITGQMMKVEDIIKKYGHN